jgi:exodeoxyribonuclease I
MKRGYRHIFIDTETTGLDEFHHIWQISAIITDENLVQLEQFDIKFRPADTRHVSVGALEKSRMTVEDLESLELSAHDAYLEFIAFLERHVARYDKTDKLIGVAYNAEFDVKFLRKFFETNADNYFGSWFWHPFVCAMQAAAYFTAHVRGSLPNFQLGTLCKCAGLGWDDNFAHDGLYDVKKTVELYKYLREFTPQL